MGMVLAVPAGGIGLGLLAFTARPDGSVMRQMASVDSEAAENVDALADFFESAARSHVVSLKTNATASEAPEHRAMIEPRKPASVAAGVKAGTVSFKTAVLPPRRPVALRLAQGEKIAPAEAAAPSNEPLPPRPPLPIPDAMVSLPLPELVHPGRSGLQLAANAGRLVSDSAIVQGAISAAGALSSLAKRLY